jgi:hypothetical protein
VADVEPTFDSCGLSTFLKISLWFSWQTGSISIIN